MKKIILPTDFSKNAENAIVYALNLFKDEKCAFYLLNTFMPSANYEQHSWHIGLEASNEQKSMKQLTALLERLSKKFKNPKHIFVPHSAMNTVVGETKKIIEQEKIELVVMGTQGATGASDVVFGTNTTQVIEKIDCPVIAVPSGLNYKAPKNILFATDYEITYSKEQLKELLHIAEHHRSHIDVLHVSSTSGLTENQQKNKAMLEEVLKDVDHQSHIVPEEDIRSCINDFQLKNDVDFLLMIKNKHTFMERLFLRSKIKQIGLHIKIPFMEIPCLPKN